jgi:hypothetical protein
MGLRLLAHYYERNEAYIALGALEAAGAVAFLENAAQSSVTPFQEIARGGYRLMVPEQELDMAIAVLAEARRHRSFEGERLSQRTCIAFSLLLLIFVTGTFMPFRTSKWHEVHDEKR